MNFRALMISAVLVVASSLGGCGKPETGGIVEGAEAILYDPTAQTVEVGFSADERVKLPVGTRVVVIDPEWSALPAEPWPEGVPRVSRVSVKEGEHSGRAGVLLKSNLRPVR